MPSNFFCFFPRPANPIRKQSAGQVPCYNSLSLVIWKKTNSLKRPNGNLAIKASGTQLSSSTLPHRVEGEEREEGCPCWNIPDLMVAVLRITMDFLFCFWPRTRNTLLTLGVLPSYHWDPVTLNIWWWQLRRNEESSTAQMTSKGLVKGIPKF